MKAGLFQHLDYKKYLEESLRTKPAGGHGFRSRLAAAAGCKPAYISRVLNQEAHLSFEQAEAINDFFGHDEDESEYFLLLVHHSRAGTPMLRARIEKRMQKLKSAHSQLKNRLIEKKSLSADDQSLYYSSWVYSAIHMLATIPAFQELPQIARQLQLPAEKAQLVALQLRDMGLISLDQGKVKVRENSVFIPADSPLVGRHHTNWRLRSLEKLHPQVPRDLHVSSVITLSRADVDVVREKLLSAFLEIKKIVKDSKEEEMLCVCLDLFQP